MHGIHKQYSLRLLVLGSYSNDYCCRTPEPPEPELLQQYHFYIYTSISKSSLKLEKVSICMTSCRSRSRNVATFILHPCHVVMCISTV